VAFDEYVGEMDSADRPDGLGWIRWWGWAGVSCGFWESKFAVAFLREEAVYGLEECLEAANLAFMVSDFLLQVGLQLGQLLGGLFLSLRQSSLLLRHFWDS